MTAPKKINGVKREVLARMCREKNRYPDEITARAAGSHYIDTDQIPDLWVYFCEHCRGWHLTSKRHNPRWHVLYGL